MNYLEVIAALWSVCSRRSGDANAADAAAQNENGDDAASRWLRVVVCLASFERCRLLFCSVLLSQEESEERRRREEDSQLVCNVCAFSFSYSSSWGLLLFG